MSDYSPTQQQQNFSQSSAFAAALQRAKQVKFAFFRMASILKTVKNYSF